MAAVDGIEGKARLKQFLQDLELLGPVRFVALTDGAILEAVGSFGESRKPLDILGSRCTHLCSTNVY